jgi:hypothetical protein
MKTGETCKETGTYKCSEHSSYTIKISEGETFPPCNHNGDSHGATWILM